MYIKIERKDNERVGKRFTFFSRTSKVNGQEVNHTDKMVFANISEAIKEGEMHGKPVYRYDSWSAVFCGKAYEKALTLTDKAHVDLYEFTVSNRYDKNSKKSYPSIMVTDFELIEGAQTEDENGSEFMDIPDSSEMPFA